MIQRSCTHMNSSSNNSLSVSGFWAPRIRSIARKTQFHLAHVIAIQLGLCQV